MDVRQIRTETGQSQHGDILLGLQLRAKQRLDPHFPHSPGHFIRVLHVLHKTMGIAVLKNVETVAVGNGKAPSAGGTDCA